MNSIKYIDKLCIFYSKEELDQLEIEAQLLKENFNCEVKILSTNISGVYKAITTQISQGPTLSGEYFDKTLLEAKVEELFHPYLKHIFLYIMVKPYKPTIVDVVTPEWLQEKMLLKGVRKGDLITDTGIDKTNLSAWINGKRPMSQPVKAMFYFYLIRPTDSSQHLSAFCDDLRDADIGSTISVVTEFITETDIKHRVLKKAKELNCVALIGDFTNRIAEIEFGLAKRVGVINY